MSLASERDKHHAKIKGQHRQEKEREKRGGLELMEKIKAGKSYFLRTY